jgi:hypothetical protein
MSLALLLLPLCTLLLCPMALGGQGCGAPAAAAVAVPEGCQAAAAGPTSQLHHPAADTAHAAEQTAGRCDSSCTALWTATDHSPAATTDQQQQQQGAVLVLDLLGAPLHSGAACLLMQLLTWLNSKPDLAANLSQNLGPSAAADRACRKSGLQDMWLAGMQVWQHLLLLTAAVAQCGVGLSMQLVQASAGKLSLGATMHVLGFVCACAAHAKTARAAASNCWHTRNSTVHMLRFKQL